jgi:hypothetical protein
MKSQPALKLIRRQNDQILVDVIKKFQKTKKPLTVFEATYLHGMAKENHIVSVDFAEAVIKSYRKKKTTVKKVSSPVA